ncbi:MAG: sensor histidine kinase, partial [Chitinophagales bacterium]
SISLSYIKFKQHEMLCLLMRDITQEKEIIEQVVASTQQFRGIFEHSPNPMLLVNKKGKLIGANEAVCDLLQYTQTTLLQMQVDDLVHPLDRIVEKSFVFQKDVKEQIEEGKNPIYSVEKRYMTAKNKVIWTRSTLKPFDHTKDNQQAAALIIVEDITHQKKAKIALQRYASRLEESNKELTQFAYVVSHDLQEPLRMVASFLSLLEMRYGETLDKNAKEYIHYAVDGAKRMSGLIEDLLTYSRVNTKGKAFEPVDCNEVLQNVINKLTPLIQAHEVAVTFTHLPTLDADDAQMEQLFENLLENAIKFHSKIQATIHIKGEKREHTYLLSVKDNGIGMEHTYQDKIFGVFQRLHTRKEYAGSGIGLAICKRIVNRHNGRIWVESELNEGSTFYVELPKVNL